MHQAAARSHGRGTDPSIGNGKVELGLQSGRPEQYALGWIHTLYGERFEAQVGELTLLFASIAPEAIERFHVRHERGVDFDAVRISQPEKSFDPFRARLVREVGYQRGGIERITFPISNAVLRAPAPELGSGAVLASSSGS
jgi:hypothetical protein